MCLWVKNPILVNIIVTVKPVYIGHAWGMATGDRFIQGDCYIQVSFELYWKLMH